MQSTDSALRPPKLDRGPLMRSYAIQAHYVAKVRPCNPRKCQLDTRATDASHTLSKVATHPQSTDDSATTDDITRLTSGVKEVSMLTRLTPEILARCLDVVSKVSRRMPGPAWVVEHATRECDQVCIAGADDRLRLLIICDEPDGDDWHARRCFAPAGQGHLIIRANRDVLRGVEAATRYMHAVATARLQFPRKRDCLFQVPAAGRPVRPRHAHRNWKIRRQGRTYSVKD